MSRSADWNGFVVADWNGFVVVSWVRQHPSCVIAEPSASLAGIVIIIVCRARSADVARMSRQALFQAYILQLAQEPLRVHTYIVYFTLRAKATRYFCGRCYRFGCLATLCRFRQPLITEGRKYNDWVR